jgi:hypothetical protein
MALDLFPTLPLRSRAWELRRNMTAAADALFVALAGPLGEPLATKDAALARAAARHADVEVLLLDALNADGRPLRQRRPQRRGRRARLRADDAAEVALVGEAEVGGEAGEVVVAGGEALHRDARAEAHAVARDRAAVRGAEDAAQMVR